MDRYADTIAKPVAFSDHAAVISSADLERLNELFPDGKAPMWGVVPGKNNVNVGDYHRIQVGDLVIFGGQGRYFACGTVACLLHNAELAEGLWGWYREDQTWEYIYALDEIRSLDIPYPEFNAPIGYELNHPPYDFHVLSEEKSRALLQRFPLVSERHVPPVSEKQYEAAAAALSGDLDRKIEAIQRAEQAYLRRMLFPGPDALCDLCGRRFEIEFLVAAHVKNRAACSDSERRDAKPRRHVRM